MFGVDQMRRSVEDTEEPIWLTTATDEVLLDRLRMWNSDADYELGLSRIENVATRVELLRLIQAKARDELREARRAMRDPSASLGLYHVSDCNAHRAELSLRVMAELLRRFLASERYATDALLAHKYTPEGVITADSMDAMYGRLCRLDFQALEVVMHTENVGIEVEEHRDPIDNVLSLSFAVRWVEMLVDQELKARESLRGVVDRLRNARKINRLYRAQLVCVVLRTRCRDHPGFSMVEWPTDHFRSCRERIDAAVGAGRKLHEIMKMISFYKEKLDVAKRERAVDLSPDKEYEALKWDWVLGILKAQKRRFKLLLTQNAGTGS